jgi:hypothetical protein
MAVIASVSAVAFTVIFGGLAHQMAAGRDPALGPKARALAAARDQAPNRRIVRRTIIVRKVHRAGPAGPGAAVAVPAPTAAPPPPPVPVPQPAPVVTSV